MIIGFDGSPLNIPFPCGVKHYAHELLRSIASVDKENKYIIFSKETSNIPIQKNFEHIKIPSNIPILKKQFFLTYYASRSKVDLFHYFEPFGSYFLQNLKIITTVHDLRLESIYPKSLKPSYYLHMIYMKLIRSRIFDKSKSFIAISEFVKNELEEYLNTERYKKHIYVIHEAVDKKFKILGYTKKPKQKYILGIGDFSPKKNIPRLIEAYGNLPQQIKDDYKLKIVSSTQKSAAFFYSQISSARLENYVNIEISPRLSELVSLYNNSSIFAFPSLYEGFGLPILEAMACGTPVLTSKSSATGEVAGNAAHLINPTSVEDIRSGIVKLLTDSKYANKLSALGLKRAKEFSWEKTARQTIEVYKNTIQHD